MTLPWSKKNATEPRGIAIAVLRLLGRIPDFEKRHRWLSVLLRWIVAAFVAGGCIFFTHGTVIWFLHKVVAALPSFWATTLQQSRLVSAVEGSLGGPIEWFLWVVATSIVGLFFSKDLFKLLGFIPDALAIKTMGLVRVTVDERVAYDQLKQLADAFWQQYLKEDDAVIRVLCISGKRLFGWGKITIGGEELDPPLKALVTNKRLEVLMPVSSKSNITIAERFKSYSPEFKKNNEYEDVSALANEVNAMKKHLRQRLIPYQSHNSLCMWRVVLSPDFCFVQNYFPNKLDNHSDHAPAMIFKRIKSPQFECFSYYYTFERMYELLKLQACADFGDDDNATGGNGSVQPAPDEPQEVNALPIPKKRKRKSKVSQNPNSPDLRSNTPPPSQLY